MVARRLARRDVHAEGDRVMTANAKLHAELHAPDLLKRPPADREHLIGPNGFAVDIRGNSMVAANLHDGDVCWVNSDRPYRSGELVLALVANVEGDDGLVVKTYVRSEDGAGCLQSEPLEGPSILTCREFSIVGPVVAIQRWLKPASLLGVRDSDGAGHHD
jgi:hypothetical protein